MNMRSLMHWGWQYSGYFPGGAGKPLNYGECQASDERVENPLDDEDLDGDKSTGYLLRALLELTALENSTSSRPTASAKYLSPFVYFVSSTAAESSWLITAPEFRQPEYMEEDEDYGINHTSCANHSEDTNVLKSHYLGPNSQEIQHTTRGRPIRGKRVSYAVWFCVSASMWFHVVASKQPEIT